MNVGQRLSLHATRRLNTVIGAVFCTVIAGVIVAIMPQSEHRATLPLLFVVVIATMAKRYGVLAGVIGSVSAAMMFAYFWFAPVGSFGVVNAAARNNLSWMLILGITASYFISFPEAPAPKRATAEPVVPNDQAA